MRKYNQLFLIIGLFISAFIVVEANGFAHGGGGGFHGGGFHGSSFGGSHGSGGFHTNYFHAHSNGAFHGGQFHNVNSSHFHNRVVHTNSIHNNVIHNNAIHNNVIHNNAIHNNAIHNNAINNNASLSNVHKHNVSTFSHANRNLVMTPHRGIPNNAFRSNVNFNHNNWNNWHGGWNNWHGGWNNWNNGWWGGWSWNNYLWGAFAGGFIASVIFNPWWYSYDYYPYDYYPYADYSYSPSIVVQQPALETTSQSYVTNPAANALPASETWVAAKNGDVPNNAVVNTSDNGKNTYYCQVQYLKNTFYGVLVPQDGCYVENSSVTMRFASYNVLVSR